MPPVGVLNRATQVTSLLTIGPVNPVSPPDKDSMRTTMEVRTLTLDTWADFAEGQEVGVFHTPEVLRAIETHVAGELRLYGAFKGEHLVGLIPLFIRSNKLYSTVTSPPPGSGIPWLGPVLMPNSPKRSTRERVNRRFISSVTEHLDLDAHRTLVHIVTSPSYEDPRPFGWNELTVIPRFTYRIPLANRTLDDVMSDFSSSTRSEARRVEAVPMRTTVEGVSGAKLVYDQLCDRYQQHGETFPMTWSLMRGLIEALQHRSQVYIARDLSGNFISGIIVLYDHSTAYYWQGGVATDIDGVSVTTLLHRQILDDLINRDTYGSVDSYDLVGANIDSISKYKANFGGQLFTYYTIESSGWPMSVAKRVYSLTK